MSIFSSDRERRLWRWTLTLVIAIYATLVLSSILSDFVYNPILSAAAFLIAMSLVGMTVLFQGLKVRPGGHEIGVALGIAVVYFFMFFRMTIPERSHLIEYSVVAVFFYEALKERARHGRRVPVPALFAITATSLIEALDESIQLFLPKRVFDPEDILFNCLAALMAVIAMTVLGWVRTWRRKAHSE